MTASSRLQLIDNLRSVFQSFGAVVDGLTDEQWAAQSLCPTWKMRDVVVHITAIEVALLGWRPGDDNPFVRMATIQPELEALSNVELAQRYHDVTDSRVTELDGMTDDEFAQPSLTPVGPGTYGRFMTIRCFDVWVHERDIRVPLGISGDDSGPTAELSLDEVHASLGYIVGKKIGLADGKGIAFDLTGPVSRRLLAKVDGRAARVDELDSPDVTLTMDSLTFMLLACGRIDPAAPLSDGRIAISGDHELGTHAARNLSFTM
ncbi:MAG TPA: maleylpyruvate isomerase family mycothiol-dependent enzyme [Ilumatobacteraceae bacterium]|nr:maleylpyruvate isomerase family mycothiol-dependent enzyme [Ilumatobacteraceae bacterium]HRB02721.1 maleylpyruvate isomerase family mycothiol-dependent enzyme [Ilumatobacteraceae bacterium]